MKSTKNAPPLPKHQPKQPEGAKPVKKATQKSRKAGLATLEGAIDATGLKAQAADQYGASVGKNPQANSTRMAPAGQKQRSATK